MRSSSRWSNNSAATATQSSSPPAHPCRNGNLKKSSSNVYRMLARRELSPRSKRSPKRFWGKPSSCRFDSIGIKSDSAKDARQELHSWAEMKSLLHLSSKYCPLMPPPRSTIAAAFSPEGKTLASTHGDHTVKILDCQTGKCLKVLSGHRRTPWVVRFHPLCPDILASGSLDHEVRLWDARTAECIGSRDFYRPIASIAFHAQGDILAVASGHKLYIWHYKRRGEASSPTIILKTRRSLRAVHFHPHAAPFLLTAEVNDLDSSDPSMMLATSPGYLRYPPPTIYLADSNSTSITTSGNDQATISVPFLTWPSIGRSDGTLLSQPADVATSSNSGSVRLLTYSTPSGQYELVLSPIQSPVREEETDDNPETGEMENVVSQTDVDAMETDVQTEGRSIFPFADPTYWDISFLQGWLIGQTQASQRAMHSQSGGAFEGVSGRSDSRHQSSRSLTIPTTGYGDGAALNNIQSEENQSEPFTSQSELVTSLAAAAAAELPCTVKLRIWSYDVRNSCAPLDDEQCRLTIPHAVLCSEMGAHFSPCGRFLAVCVACVMPGVDSDSGFQGQIQHDAIGASTSPTRHPISSHQVMYELRIYSLEEATFGSVLASRAIRAAHCLTSIQFSPTSEHLLLAYGRRHSSLLKSVMIDGQVTVPIYTILEIYRVSDMELVRVLSSAEDEVNVACFHPAVGGGLVYGTKEGKLRILQCDISKTVNNEGSAGPNQTLFEVPADALER